MNCDGICVGTVALVASTMFCSVCAMGPLAPSIVLLILILDVSPRARSAKIASKEPRTSRERLVLCFVSNRIVDDPRLAGSFSILQTRFNLCDYLRNYLS